MNHLNFVMKRLTAAFLLCLTAFFAYVSPSHAHKPIRIIAVESGPYLEYYHMLHGIAVRLQELGYFKKVPPYEPKINGAEILWKWMSENSGPRIIFMKDGFYSAGWNALMRKEIARHVSERIRKENDVSIILALGTSAGQEMARLDTDVPVIVASTTNAVEAGIASSLDDSGKDNLIALLDPLRYRRQLEYFHNILPFRRLGIAYEDTPTGRAAVSLGEIESAAKDFSIELVPCVAEKLYDILPEIIGNTLEFCHKTFVEKNVDAVYLTSLSMLNPEQIPDVIAPLINAHIPAFSQTGEVEVAKGVLLGFVENSFHEGRYAAEVILSIAEGASPRSLSQRYRHPLQLAINLGTAASIGWNPDLSILCDVSEFY